MISKPTLGDILLPAKQQLQQLQDLPQQCHQLGIRCFIVRGKGGKFSLILAQLRSLAARVFPQPLLSHTWTLYTVNFGALIPSLYTCG